MEVVDVLVSLCVYSHRPYGAVEFLIELSKRLLVAQKELGLPYLPEFGTVMVSISVILTQVEFEHEHLSILKLLVFLFEWRTKSGMLCLYLRNIHICFFWTCVLWLCGMFRFYSVHMISAYDQAL